jgi:ureidoacrylate peracid hydrolase
MLIAFCDHFNEKEGDMKKITFIAIGMIVMSALAVSTVVAAETKAINLGKPALLVIDVANDVCHEKGALAKMGVWKYGKEHGTFENIARAIKLAEKKGIPVIRIWLEYQPGAPDIPKRGFFHIAKKMFGKSLIEHTWGAEPFAGLEPGEGQIEVIKKRTNSFHNTNLKSLLDALQVDTLLITGVSCHMCINGTIVGAVDEDYNVIALHDAIAGPSEGLCGFLFTKLWPQWAVKVLTVSEAFGE